MSNNSSVYGGTFNWASLFTALGVASFLTVTGLYLQIFIYPVIQYAESNAPAIIVFACLAMWVGVVLWLALGGKKK